MSDPLASEIGSKPNANAARVQAQRNEKQALLVNVAKMQKEAAWRKALPVHPAANKLRPATDEEIQNLGGDLKRHGQHEPVVLARIAGGAEQLLDGRTRLDVREALGEQVVDADGKIMPTVPSRTIELADDAGALAFVLSLNLYRRHLSLEDRRGLLKEVLKTQPEKSDRQIGRIVGLSHPKVATERKKLEATGDVEKITTSTDTAGRKQPRQRAARRPAKKLTAVATKPPTDVTNAIKTAVATTEAVNGDGQRLDLTAAEVERLATRLLANDRKSASEIYNILAFDDRRAIKVLIGALGRGLGGRRS